MAINFDALPDTVGSGPRLLPKGSYYATIERAEMKKPKDTSKPDYLNLMYRLKDVDGNDRGVLWDILTESNNEWILKKLKRFVIAVDIDMKGRTFELKDLCKPIIGTDLIVDITIDERQQPARNQIDLFSGDIYYPMSEAGKVFGLGDLELPFDENDSEDIFTQKKQIQY